VIGLAGGLPWHIPGDLKHFKAVTMGHPIIMGRKTHESIGRPLPGRRNIVVTRRADYRAGGCEVVHSFDEALRATRAEEEVFVIGGAELYVEALPRAERVYLTRVEGSFEGDTYFPDTDWSLWHEVLRETYEADAENPHPHVFSTLERSDAS
jgi:dihydrofolate reductase